MFGRLARSFPKGASTWLKHKSFSSKEEQIKYASALTLGSLGTWYLMQQFHPSSHQYTILPSLERFMNLYHQALQLQLTEEGAITLEELEKNHINPEYIEIVSKILKSPDKTSDYIKGIDDKQILSIIAAQLAEKDLSTLAGNIQGFALPEHLRIQYAEKLAEKDLKILAYNIKGFALPEHLRIQYAEKLAEKDLKILAYNIEGFALPEHIRIKYAEKVAEKDLKLLAKNIQNFALPEHLRIQYAEKLAEEDLWGLASHIQKFALPEHLRIQYAEKLAKKHLPILAQNIQNFALSEDLRIQYAEKLAEKDLKILAYNIEGFALPEHIRIQYAEKLAEKDLKILAYNIEGFALPEHIRIQYAEKLAEKDLKILAYNIKGFALSEDLRIQYAEKLAEKDLKILAYNIKGFALPEHIRIKYAEKVAEKDLKLLAKNIQNFALPEHLRIQYAEKLAEEDLWGLAQNIQNFALPEDLRIQYAEKLAEKDCCALFYNIERFKILDKEKLSYFGQKIFNSPNFIPTLKNLFLHTVDNLFTANLIEDHLYSKWKIIFPDINTENLDKCAFFRLCLDKSKRKLFSDKYYDFTLDKIFSFRGRAMVSFLIKNFLSVGGDPKFQQCYEHLTNYRNHPLKGAALVAILPSRWALSASISLEDPIIAQLALSLSKLDNYLKTEKSPLAISLLTFIKELESTKSLDYKEKIEFVSKLCSSSKDPVEILKALRLLNYFISQNRIDVLRNLSFENLIEDLENAFKKTISSHFDIPSLSLEELIDRYEKTFGTLRIPYGMENYSQVLKDSEPEVLATLKRFKTSIILGTFEQERYRTDNNIHLAKIAKEAPDIFEAWKHLFFEKKAPHGIDNGYQNFSFRDFLEQNLQDNHFNKDTFPLLTQNLTKGGIEQKSVSDPELAVIQQQCIELMENKLPQEAFSQKIQQILDVLQKKMPSLEFTHDLEALLEALEEKEHKKERIMFTTDWQDLFLAGSEVGSCQRLDGSASLNKCLLAYCLDGKNGMIAIKGKDGTITARAILRLLWDEEENKPVLFLERIYPHACSEKHIKAIETAAKKCAKQLGCTLFQKSKDLSTKKIVSLGSSCPYEYVDSSGGVREKGKFHIFV